MTSKPLLMHIGYHKTATTWMQQKLFKPEHGYQQIATHRDAFTHIVKPHGLRFDPVPLRDILAKRISTLSGDIVPVFSSEILSGHPFQGGHESDVFAERLKQIVPNARILISIRSQMKILPSVYMQYLLRGGTMPYKKFFEGINEVGYFGFTPDHFEYDLLIYKYQQLFGRENVRILTQESLQQDMSGAALKLAIFSENTAFRGLSPSALRIYAASYPEYASPVLRRINHVQSSTLNTNPIFSLGHTPKGLYRAAGYVLRLPILKTLIGDKKPISDYVKLRFSGYFSASNERLAALCPHQVDLSDYP